MSKEQEELISARANKCSKTWTRKRFEKHGENFPKLPTQRASLQQWKQTSRVPL